MATSGWILILILCAALLVIAAIAPHDRPTLILNAALLTGAVIFTAEQLERRIGSTGPLLAATLVFASGVPSYVYQAQAQIGMLAATLVGLGLLIERDLYPAGGPPELYPEADSTLRLSLRWLLGGALVALPATLHPLYLILLFPVIYAVLRERRRTAMAALAVGVLSVIIGALVTGITPLDLWVPGGGDPSIWRLNLDLGLLGWNSLYLLAGRHLGLLPYFLPMLLVLVGWGGRSGFRLALAVVIGLFGLLNIDPFDLALGAPVVLGNPAILPLYGALWLLPTKPVRPIWMLLVLAASAPFLYTFWLTPGALPLDENGHSTRLTPVARRFLPYESTQQRAPRGMELQLNGMSAWTLDGNMEIAGADALRITVGAPADLFLSGPLGLEGVQLEFDHRAGNEILIGGGELAGTVFRSDGGVTFEVGFNDRSPRHPFWLDGRTRRFQQLRLTLPGESEDKLRFRLGAKLQEEEKR